MNRRDLFKRSAALGIVLSAPEPLQRIWALGGLPQGSDTGEFVTIVDSFSFAPPWPFIDNENVMHFNPLITYAASMETLITYEASTRAWMRAKPGDKVYYGYGRTWTWVE